MPTCFPNQHPGHLPLYHCHLTNLLPDPNNRSLSVPHSVPAPLHSQEQYSVVVLLPSSPAQPLGKALNPLCWPPGLHSTHWTTARTLQITIRHLSAWEASTASGLQPRYQSRYCIGLGVVIGLNSRSFFLCPMKGFEGCSKWLHDI